MHNLPKHPKGQAVCRCMIIPPSAKKQRNRKIQLKPQEELSKAEWMVITVPSLEPGQYVNSNTLTLEKMTCWRRASPKPAPEKCMLFCCSSKQIASIKVKIQSCFIIFTNCIRWLEESVWWHLEQNGIIDLSLVEFES